jgi:signal transduction histidine kinase
MTVSFERIDPAKSAQSALDAIRSLIDEQNVQLVADIPPDLPQIEADPLRLRQILNNLLSNAAKFTNKGHIRLLMEQESETIHIAVEDTGIGIRAEDRGALFKPFEQVQDRESRVVGGTGLGLPITRWLVEMHNGRIWLNSQPGQGSAFHLLLPINQPEDSPTEVSLGTSPLSLD